MSFRYQDPTLETSWRSIILLGRNVASYKFALAKTLLQLETKNSLVLLEDIAVPFAENIAEHLSIERKQITSSSSKFLDICEKYNGGEVDQDTLRTETVKLGFLNVIDAFHNVANDDVPFRFFDDSRKDSNGITITDNFYRLLESEQKDNFLFEVNARWRLWETAISLKVNPALLSISNDYESELLFTVDKNLKRIDVTSSRDALNGYQKGKCFYCKRSILIERGSERSCDVDHFFPHNLKHHGFEDINNIWNLVLSCQDCNRGHGGKFEKIPKIEYLTALNKRNNFYIESHHPLRETIIKQTGISPEIRHKFLQRYFDRALEMVPVTWKPKECY
jgi:5-methylcytosine-specific restriction endonuclease McrA